MSRDENGAALERAGMDGFEYLVDLIERVLFDERGDLDPAVEHQLERLRIEVGRTTPVSDRPGVKGHQVGEADLDLVHGEANDSERCAVIEQAESRFLARVRSRALENDPFALPQA